MKNKVIYSLVTGLLIGGTFLGAGVTAHAERLEHPRTTEFTVSQYVDEQGLTIGVYADGAEVVMGAPAGLEDMVATPIGADDETPTTSGDVNMDYNPSVSAPVKLDNSTNQSKAQTQTETTAPVETPTETPTEDNKSVEEQTVENKDTDTKKKDDSSAKKTKKKDKKEETNKDEGFFLNTCNAVGGFFKSCGKAVGEFFGGIGDFFVNLF